MQDCLIKIEQKNVKECEWVEKAKDYIRLMRVHHYIKNLLVFAALACSGQLFCREKLLTALTGFGAFCAASSVVYIINDIRDQDKDLLHPTKRNRPIASGRVSKKNARILAAALALFAILGNFFVFDPAATVLLGLYLVLNWLYSSGLKNIPLVDVTILVSGFLLRIMYGAVVTGIEISDWLYLTVIALAYYFALGKRRNELRWTAQGKDARKVLRYYSLDFLDKNMYICLALALVFYALWCMDASTTSRFGGVKLIFTVPIVLLITMRYSMDVEGESDGDPVEVLLHDQMLLALCVIYFAMMFAILYF